MTHVAVGYAVAEADNYGSGAMMPALKEPVWPVARWRKSTLSDIDSYCSDDEAYR